jgi:hypothetical protein
VAETVEGPLRFLEGKGRKFVRKEDWKNESSSFLLFIYPRHNWA